MNNKSFTLIELLVVIVIIGILAGVIMISTSSSIDKANLAKAKGFYNNTRNSLLLNTLSEWSADYVNKNGDSWTLDDQVGMKDGIFHNGDLVACSTSACPQTITDEAYGTVLDFDGIDDYIFFDPIPNIDYEYTFTVWVYIENGNNGLIFKRAHCDGISLSNKKITYWIKRNDHASDSITSNNEIMLDQWNFIAMTADLKEQKMAIYVNGVETSKTVSMDDSFPFMLSGGTSIGKGSGSSPGCPGDGTALNGKVKEFAIYNTYLTEAQIKEKYMAELKNFISKP